MSSEVILAKEKIISLGSSNNSAGGSTFWLI